MEHDVSKSLVIHSRKKQHYTSALQKFDHGVLFVPDVSGDFLLTVKGKQAENPVGMSTFFLLYPELVENVSMTVGEVLAATPSPPDPPQPAVSLTQLG